MKGIKKILPVCLLVLSAVVFTACGKQAAPVDPAMDFQVAQNGLAMFDQLILLEGAELDSTIEYYEDIQDTVFANGLNSWKSSQKELGAFLDVTDTRVEMKSDGGYKLTVMADFEKRDCEYIVAFDKNFTKLTELTFNPVYSLGEKMKQALVNLAVGMGTVFAVLIFLTWIISLFKYINKAQEKLEKKQTASADAVPSPAETSETASANAAAAQTQNSDEELQVVIAAAIAAYEEESGTGAAQPALQNGIVVRSYRRS